MTKLKRKDSYFIGYIIPYEDSYEQFRILRLYFKEFVIQILIHKSILKVIKWMD